PVLGVTDYTVKVNGVTVKTITDGKTSTRITLTKAGDNKITVSNANESEEINVYAYTVKFDTQGAAGMSVADKYVAIGDELVLPEPPEASGYEFGGWYNSVGGANGNGQKLDKTTVFNTAGDMMLFANWNHAMYNVTLNYGDGHSESGATTGQGLATYQEDFEFDAIPIPNDARFVFLGWFSSPDGGVQYTDEYGKSMGVWENRYGGVAYARYLRAFDLTAEGNNEYSVICNAAVRSSTLTSITVPKEYDGKLITVVDSYAFRNCINLEVINIPNTVTTIEVDSSAFENCINLKAVNIYNAGNNDAKYSSVGGSLLMKNVGGTGVSLKLVPRGVTGEFTVSAGVTDIPARAFYRTGVTKVNVPAGVQNVYGNAFYDCPNLNTVSFASATGDEKITVAARAFTLCSKLQEVNLPAQLTEFDKGMFYGCTSLANINIDENNANYKSIDGLPVANDGQTLIFFPSGRKTCEFNASIKAIGEGAFIGATGLTEITIKSWITSIAKETFSGCTSLKKVVFEGDDDSSDALTIGNDAFNGCTALTTVVFGTYDAQTEKYVNIPNITKINEKTFFRCTSLKSIVLPDSVTEICANAFQSCTNLRSVDFGNNLNAIRRLAFDGCSSLTAVTFPATLQYINSSAFSNCSMLSKVNFASADSVAEYFTMTINDGVFANCKALTRFDIPTYVDTIGSGVFMGCVNLSNITATGSDYFKVEDGVLYELDSYDNTKYSKLLFYPYSKTGSFVIPDNMPEISEGAFKDNPSLVEIVIPSSVTFIGSEAFSGCTALRKVTFMHGENDELTLAEEYYDYWTEENVVEDSYDIFAHCTKLVSIEMPKCITSIPTGFADGCRSLLSVAIPSSVTSIGEGAFSDCTSLSIVEFEKKGNQSVLKKIGYAAFAGCESLEQISIPGSVTMLEAGAFGQCSSLKSVNFEEGTDPLFTATSAFTSAYGVFGGTVSLKNIVLPERLVNIGRYMFAGSGLETINIPASVRDGYITENVKDPMGFGSYEQTAFKVGIGDYSFDDCTSLTTVTSTAGGTGYLSVDTGAFSGCTALTSVAFPKRLAPMYETTEGAEADNERFELVDDLLNVFIPNYSGELTVFDNAPNLESITVEEGGKFYESQNGILYTKGKSLMLYIPAGKPGEVRIGAGVDTIASTAFAQAKKFTSLIIEGDASCEEIEIDDSMFEGNTAIQSVTLSNRVTYIGDWAFAECTNLETVILGDELHYIGESAFAETKISSISLPVGITSIEYETFANCTNLSSVEMPGVEEIGEGAFSGCTSLKNLVLPETVEFIDDDAFLNVSFDTITLPKEFVSQFGDMGCRAASSGVMVYGDDGNPEPYTVNTIIKNGVLSWYVPGADPTTYTVPATVTSIGAYAFAGDKQLKTIVFEESSALQSIGAYAFADCTALTTIVLPENLTSIGESAFTGCTALTSVVLPGTLMTLGIKAFNECSALKTVKFNSGTGTLTLTDPKSEGNSQFNKCVSLESVDFGGRSVIIQRFLFSSPNGADYYIPLKEVKGIENATRIRTTAFRNCKDLVSITIPAGVTSLDTYMFMGCTSLTTVNGLDHITTWSSATTTSVFDGCSSLASIDLSSATYIGTNMFRGTAIKKVTIPSTVTSIAAGAFLDCANLEEVVFEHNIANLAIANMSTSISSIFGNCVKLKTVDLGGRTTELKPYLFYNTPNLESVINAENVTSIGVVASPSQYGNVFVGCTKLVEFTVGANVEKLYAGTFVDCTAFTTLKFAAGKDIEINATYSNAAPGIFSGKTNLKTVDFGGRNATINARAFEGCDKLATIVNTENISSIGNAAFKNTAVSAFTVSDKLTALGGEAFAGTALIEISLPYDTLENVGERAFADCASLAKVTFTGGWRAINQLADGLFDGCGNLAELVMPTGVQRIGERTFAGTKLTSLNIGEGLLTLGNGAFDGCASLNAVSLPASLASIEGNPFSGCTGISSANFNLNGNTYYTYDNGAIYNGGKANLVSSLSTATTFTLDDETTVINDSAFAKSKLVSIDIPAKYKQLPAKLFEGSADLTTVTLHEGLTTIGAYAFKDCTALTTLTIPSTVTAIEVGAFEGCTSLKTIVLPEGLLTLGAGAFKGCKTLATITIPAGLYELSDNLFEDCTALTTVTFAAGSRLDEIGAYVFKNSGLKSITVPKGVTALSNHQFAFAGELTSVTFATDFEAGKTAPITIGVASYDTATSGPFEGCVKLKSVDWGSRIAFINRNAFNGCTALDTLDFTNVRNIGRYAFAGCTALKSVVIPAGATEIGYGAFRGSGITSITVPATVKLIDYGAFENCAALKTVTFEGANCSSIGQRAFAGCTGITKITIPGTVALVADQSFAGWTKDQTIVLSDMTSIPDDWGTTWCGNAKVEGKDGVTLIAAKTVA
ncbi:MAG: leucine-rich repeat protein, partial [Clostridiales bacterium]|nr:leucine-rich repeat protein [Clostridiales bacterium]